MPDSTEPTGTFTIRMSEEEKTRLEELRERLQGKAARGVRVTQRMTVLAALDALESQLDKLERDKGRRR